MDASPFYSGNKWLGALGVLLVNGFAWLLIHIIRKIAQDIPKYGAFGCYLVLMPLGFLTLRTWDDPTIWFTYGFAIAGLLLIARCWPRTE